MREQVQECQDSNLADAVREASSDTEESACTDVFPTWWSKLIQDHTSHLDTPVVSADKPILAMSACSGMCLEIAVFQATGIDQSVSNMFSQFEVLLGVHFLAIE